MSVAEGFGQKSPAGPEGDTLGAPTGGLLGTGAKALPPALDAGLPSAHRGLCARPVGFFRTLSNTTAVVFAGEHTRSWLFYTV